MKHIKSEDEAIDFIKQIKKKYYDARHNVYAYIIGDGTIKKCSDDGEPSKTAGIPIMQMLESEGVTDVVCVVTRYFGGTLLGTGGLVRAYTLSAKTGLEQSGIKILKPAVILTITLPYTQMSNIEYICKTFDAEIEDKIFSQDISVKLSVQQNKSEEFIKVVRDKTGINTKIDVIENSYR
jgi:uncharacterized YigZ family protein